MKYLTTFNSQLRGGGESVAVVGVGVAAAAAAAAVFLHASMLALFESRKGCKYTQLEMLSRHKFRRYFRGWE